MIIKIPIYYIYDNFTNIISTNIIYVLDINGIVIEAEYLNTFMMIYIYTQFIHEQKH